MNELEDAIDAVMLENGMSVNHNYTYDQVNSIVYSVVAKLQEEYQPMNNISKIAGKDAPVAFNSKGGGQSHIPVRFDLIDAKALFEMAAVLHTGAVKYGANNWRKIDVEDHLNHLIMHAYAYLAGDQSDDHLSHIMCRSMFAQSVHITNQETTENQQEENHNDH